jgi:hypothetical protein
MQAQLGPILGSEPPRAGYVVGMHVRIDYIA